MRLTAATAIQLALRQLRLDRVAGRVLDLGEQGDESNNDESVVPFGRGAKAIR
jgi:hypothetical protein